jgi:putative dimethyl sulfoxide reductase chaperone
MNTDEEAAARADLYLALATSFQVPHVAGFAEAMRLHLADDLQELSTELGLDCAEAVAQLREEMRRLPDQLALLQCYSSVFLSTGARAWINVGRYLDGALNGGTVRAMEQAYLQCGLVRNTALRDLPDHVAVVLEFVCGLYGATAQDPPKVDPGHFLHELVAPWVVRFEGDLARAAEQGLVPNPYHPLARILSAAVQRHAVEPPMDPALRRRQQAMLRARGLYAARGITAEDLQEIRAKLQERGLSTDHLPGSAEEALQRIERATGRSAHA